MSEDLSQIAGKENTKYRSNYGSRVTFLTMLVLLSTVLVFLFCVVVMIPQMPRYFASTTQGDNLRLYSLSEPLVTNDYMRSWIGQVASGVYTVSFNRWQKQLQPFQKYFKKAAWATFSDSYKGAFAKALQANQLEASAVVDGEPQIVLQRVVDGKWTWYISVPLLVQYSGDGSVAKQQLTIAATVSRVNTLDSYQGIAISDFNAQLLTQVKGGT